MVRSGLCGPGGAEVDPAVRYMRGYTHTGLWGASRGYTGRDCGARTACREEGARQQIWGCRAREAYGEQRT